MKGNLTVTNGTFNTTLASATHLIGGDFMISAGTVTGTNTTYTLNGTADQNVSLTPALQRLTINKTTGVVILGSDLTVSNTLNFISGNIYTANYKTIIPATSLLTGAGQSTGWVNGNLQKGIPAGTGVSKTFEVGGTNNYAPVSVLFSGVATAGFLTAIANASDQPEIDYSGLDPAKSVNISWGLYTSGVVYTTAAATFNWASADIDAGASTAAFKTGLFDGTNWILTGFTAPGATSIQATGLTSLGDFAVGENITKSTWTGSALTSDWFTPKNWLGLIPTASLPTLIPNGIPAPRVYPVLTSGTGIVNDLTVENAASLTINAGTLKIAGTLLSSANITASAGTVEFNGSLPQTVPAASFTGNIVKNLMISNDVSLADISIVSGTLTIADGKTFATNDNLVLKSDVNGTANIASLPVDGAGNATAFITGKVSIERYIPARKAWRMLSVPIKTSSTATICSAWQENAYTPSFGPNPNPNPGYGVHITGGTVENGFDQSPTNSPSVKVYNNATNAFVPLPPVPGTFALLNTYPAYFMYIRGDRGIDLSQGADAAVTQTTLRIKGEVNTGKQTSMVNATNLTILGNPYPSAINFATITKNNTKNSFYIWDPKLAGNNGLGAYVTVSWNTSTNMYDFTTSASPVSEYIPSGEAILIQSLDGINPGSVSINETDKTTNGNDMLFGRTASAGQKIRTNLYAAGKDGASLLDAALITYDDRNSNRFDKEDVRKLSAGGENISLRREGNTLAIERKKTISENDTTFLNIDELKSANYKLEIIAERLSMPGITAVLKDKFSEKLNNTALNTDGKTEILFSVTNDPASFAADRFSIVFSRAGGAYASRSEKNNKNDARVNLNKSTNPKTMIVYPNPVQNNMVSIQLSLLEKGNYNIQLFNTNGQLLKQLSLVHNGGSLGYNFPLDNNLPAGKYQLKLSGGISNYVTSVIKE